jgi:hypothetical protein
LGILLRHWCSFWSDCPHIFNHPGRRWRDHFGQCGQILDAGPFSSNRDCRVGSALTQLRQPLPLRFKSLQAFFLLTFKALLAEHQLVKIYQVAVKIRAVDAGKLHFAAHGHTTRTAHACAIDHDGVEAHHRADAIGPRQFRASLHHREWTNSDDFADSLVFL